VAPAVIHWKQDHYAAILEHTNDACLILDPTFAEPQHWVRDAVIEEEASSYFLVPEKLLPATWRRVAQSEAAYIHGQGAEGSLNDGQDHFKPKCKSCNGMPQWWVSEPFGSLWVADTPVSWTTSEGLTMDFMLMCPARGGNLP
jgi:hypothetical protein